MSRYRIKVWRNDPRSFSPTVDEFVNSEKLGDWFSILEKNAKSKSNEPLIEKVLVEKYD